MICHFYCYSNWPLNLKFPLVSFNVSVLDTDVCVCFCGIFFGIMASFSLEEEAMFLTQSDPLDNQNDPFAV